MAEEYIKKIRTSTGDKQIDYTALANLPTTATEETDGLMSSEDKQKLNNLSSSSPEIDYTDIMRISVYDPQGYNQDVFAYANTLSGRKIYGVLWNKVSNKCTRLFDAADITTDTTNFLHWGTVNTAYENPFDDLYPWKARKLCNYSIPDFKEIWQHGYDVRDAVVAWEGEEGFSYDPAPGIGVGVYTPQFWHTSYDSADGRVFALSDTEVPGWTVTEPTISGRWYGTLEEIDWHGIPTQVMGCRPGMPIFGETFADTYEYAYQGGMTLDDIYTYDATTMLYIVEYGNFHSQRCIGNGLSWCYASGTNSTFKLLEAAENTNVVKFNPGSYKSHILEDAVLCIGTTAGSWDIAKRLITSVEIDAADDTLYHVTFDGEPVTVTTDMYWSIKGRANRADAEIGSKTGFIGTNNKENAYYRGQVFHAGYQRYLLGLWKEDSTDHIWMANNRYRAESSADGLDTADAGWHDTGVMVLTEPLHANGKMVTGYPDALATAPGVSVPPFIAGIDGSSSQPFGDWFNHDMTLTENIFPVVGGSHSVSGSGGRFCIYWRNVIDEAGAIPVSKTANRILQ